MTFGSLRSLHATPIKHHDRGLTLVFGSDGQFSLLGGEIPTPPVGLPPTLTASITVPLSESPSVSPIPKLDATTASLTGTSSFAPVSTGTFAASTLSSSSYDSSSTTTGIDTSLPAAPSGGAPSPSPTGVADSSDHGVGAPFYLAIVLASISFVGCIAAFVAWWIRSRARKRDFELEDPWHRRDALSDADDPSTNNADDFEKGPRIDTETQTRPYYLPASIVRRGSSNLLTVPHTIPTLKEDMPRSSILHPALAARRYHDPYSQRSTNQNVPLSQTNNVYSRPSTARLDTGLSVQESTRTLGRLRITNRVPGDVTSGDEGGMNMRHVQSNAGLLPAPNAGGPNAVLMEASAMQNARFDQSNRPIQDGDSDIPLEPPGPATFPWGRRTDAIAALRRTRRRTPETTAQTYKNGKYGGYWYPALDEGARSTKEAVPDAINREEGEKDILADPPSDPQGWTNSLKSSFWQAVDAMTGSRPPGHEPCVTNAGGGSRFTPAPQRTASRRSPVSLTHTVTSFPSPDGPTTRSLEPEAKCELTQPEKSALTQETLQTSTHSRLGSSSTRPAESEIPLENKYTIEWPDSLPPRASHLNRNLSTGTYRRHPDSLRADTRSVYSTDSGVARANLRRYGYGGPIPSSWSALGSRRGSELDLDRMYVPPSLPIPSSNLGLRSITPSLLTLESRLGSSSVVTSASTSSRARTRTPAHSLSDATDSGAGTVRSGRHAHANTTSDGDTWTISTYTMSRNDTIQSGRSTIGHETAPLPSSSSMTSSMLTRKKGIATRRKRPRPPARAPSTASSVQSIESGLSIREVAVRRALLERRKKVKALESLKDHENSPIAQSRHPSIPSSLE